MVFTILYGERKKVLGYSAALCSCPIFRAKDSSLKTSSTWGPRKTANNDPSVLDKGRWVLGHLNLPETEQNHVPAGLFEMLLSPLFLCTVILLCYYRDAALVCFFCFLVTFFPLCFKGKSSLSWICSPRARRQNLNHHSSRWSGGPASALVEPVSSLLLFSSYKGPSRMEVNGLTSHHTNSPSKRREAQKKTDVSCLLNELPAHWDMLQNLPSRISLPPCSQFWKRQTSHVKESSGLLNTCSCSTFHLSLLIQVMK